MILTLLFGDVVLGASSANHAVRAQVSERHVRCFVLFPLLFALVCFEVLLSHASLGLPTLLHHRLCHSLSDILPSLSSIPLSSVAATSSL